MSSGKCRDGVELNGPGPCPSCGATMRDNCRGRNYYEFMARAQALADAKSRERMEKDMRQRYEQPDRRMVGDPQ